jgi:hypothetical protein
MSEVGNAVLNKPEQRPNGPDAGAKRVTELRVTGHLMTLETGVFCVFQAPGSMLGQDETGLPGVRISLPPGSAGNPDAVSISTFRPDGWLSGNDAAALVRVIEGPAQVLVTVYQSSGQGVDRAPRLQVLRLSTDAAAPAPDRSNGAAPGAVVPQVASVMGHVQRTGDVGARMGEWLGVRGSKLWIEGFAVLPPDGVSPEDLEYQAVLGRGWNSPWMEGGKFCGSRGMALPLLGIRLRLKGSAAKTHTLRYAASFVDGTEVGPVNQGEACESVSLAALEALQVLIEPLGAPRQAAIEPSAKAKATNGLRRPPAAKKPLATKPPLVTPPLVKPVVVEPPAIGRNAGPEKPALAARKPAKPGRAGPSARRAH